MKCRYLVMAACLATASFATTEPVPIPSIAEKTGDLERRVGLLTLYPDPDHGRVWLELPPPGDRGVVGEYLYVEGLVTGLGSNPVGLDRGRLGSSRVVRFRLVGNRVLIEEPNFSFRALGGDAPEKRAVAESFATSVLWGAEIAARSAEGGVLVDITSFLVRDAHGVATTLERTAQGSFVLDVSRSAVDFDGVLAFPKNLEFEAVLTFGGKDPGRHVSSVAPTPDTVTVVQHHSLVQLPDPDYKPREFDPRTGSITIGFADYTAPLTAPIERRWIVRHRLQKVYPDAEHSRVREPIVYYVDPGIPEPVRSAVIDGASWWAAAFDRAGFEDGFRVEMLPEDAHPLDVRYNVIEWVHRSTRGWSYGGGVVDPRTGERVKGHVSLGSLRVRQDIRIFEGLAGADATGTGNPDDPVQLALSRIRQLAAHEVGHTIGLAHNFAASVYGRASVMDYPAPWVSVASNGELDFSEAYAVGVGAWDLHAIRYAYSEFPPEAAERRELRKIVEDGLDKGLLFLSDADARPPGAAQPLANLWDNGPDPVAELENVLHVRRVALANFGEDNVATGLPLALLEEALVPVFFYHRYQAEAAAKSLGGVVYSYAVRGDGQLPARPVDGGTQRRALAALLAILEPAALDLPDSLIEVVLPRPAGYGRNREMFVGGTAPTFDALGAASTAAGQIVALILQEERLARMADAHRRDASLPSVRDVVYALVGNVFADVPDETPRHTVVRHVVQWVVVERMLALAADPAQPPTVRSALDAALRRLGERLDKSGADDATRAHRALLVAEIDRYLTDREWRASERWSPVPLPPGSPIGASECSQAAADGS